VRGGGLRGRGWFGAGSRCFRHGCAEREESAGGSGTGHLQQLSTREVSAHG
jgi:hypothetical protein